MRVRCSVGVQGVREWGDGACGAVFREGVKLRLVPHFDLLPAVKNSKTETYTALIKIDTGW